MNKIGKIISVAAVLTVLTKVTKNILGKSKLEPANANGEPVAPKKPSKPAKQQNDQGQQPKAQHHTSNNHSPNKSSKSNQKSKTQDFSDSRNQKMYKDLGMTDEQRKRYEADYQNLLSDWDAKNPGKQMDEHEKTRQNNSALSAVLNEDQYAIYRDWAADHAG